MGKDVGKKDDKPKPQEVEVPCPACGGSGWNPKTKVTCKTCKGTGKIRAVV